MILSQLIDQKDTEITLLPDLTNLVTHVLLKCFVASSLGASLLRIHFCHCCGLGLTPAWGTLHALGTPKKKKKKGF